MAQYRRRPLVIEASQWHGWEEGPNDLGVTRYPHGTLWREDRHGWISTIGGGHLVSPGDWIITDDRGEKYPVKNDVFHNTYEAVTHTRQ
jgi:hypothetical protein